MLCDDTLNREILTICKIHHKNHPLVLVTYALNSASKCRNFKVNSPQPLVKLVLLVDSGSTAGDRGSGLGRRVCWCERECECRESTESLRETIPRPKMSLWVDKYRPKALSTLDFHRDQASQLKNLVKQGDFPHLLVYGPSGAGKKTRVTCLLRELYGPGVEKLRMESVPITTPSGKKLDVKTISSNYHIEVNPSDAGIYDRCVVMELVKNAAQTHQLDPSGQRDFKVVVLTEVDSLSVDAQHALRRTMEKYVSTCRLILISNSTSRVIPAIRSRCLGVRVAAPLSEDITSILQNVCKKEGLSLPMELAKKIVDKSERNLRVALLMCEACKVQETHLKEKQEPILPQWQIFLIDTARTIMHEQSPKQLMEVRGKLYELLSHNIPIQIIFKGLLKELVSNCDMKLKAVVVEEAAYFEHRVHQGSKGIFHLEAFVAKFMCIYKKFMEDSVIDMF